MAVEYLAAFQAQCIVIGSVVSYLCFKRYEPDSPLALVILLVFVPTTLISLTHPWTCLTLRTCLAACLAHTTLVSILTVIYRISPLHPLARFPGPLPAKVSKLWMSYICAHGKQHIYYRRLHDQYGDFVRIGPNELSIRNASAISAILGHDGLPKGPWWSNRPHAPVLVGLRKHEEHSRRRKAWNRAFTTTAVKGYEEIVVKRTRQLIERLENLSLQRDSLKGKSLGAILDLGQWLSYFATDLMGDMSFGGGFELMRDGNDARGLWQMLNQGLEATASLAHAPWTFNFIRLMPSIKAVVARVQGFADRSVEARLKMGASRRDIFFYLNDEEHDADRRPSFEELSSDAMLAIIAGSDTSATVLTALFWNLVRRPAAYKALQDEIDREFPGGEEPMDAVKLSRMEWLNACINEAARLHPPVPSGSQRSVMPGMGPVAIGEHIIPEGTQVFVHTYSVHRDARSFSAPDSFLPERWISQATLAEDSQILTRFAAHNPAAFHPFSYGPANCAGKNFAMMEMRTAVCWLVQRLEFQPPDAGKLGPGVNDWEDSLRDFYVMRKAPLWMRITRRHTGGVSENHT
ncbi:high nitrogen upregulated cytochrome P450 monooxygenase 2 [Auriscalpium vulgare]|uniref:High nitrogen upregulated cytochrome P450 monooxygenase 2 n=1 Tax=Auriscalpium vulgare TaxID=40419 RepID=A0ACB8S3M9_9AGAM|nr:high nitrogen upregulated cytochrome P450 monooxygenase 2 [Auriscalpium vulgare]